MVLRDVPTHVGVDPPKPWLRRGAYRRPHARGGGPKAGGTVKGQQSTSPRTWGWTPSSLRVSRTMGDVPTHVGVDPTPRRLPRFPLRRPHARGGGPRRRRTGAPKAKTSPRTWGWTLVLEVLIVVDADVPTHVGVDRAPPRLPRPRGRRPHARGGGPSKPDGPAEGTRTSPRTWGWTRTGTPTNPQAKDVPTHVGVDPPPNGED